MGKPYSNLEEAQKVQKSIPGSTVIVNPDGTFEVKKSQYQDVKEFKQMPSTEEMKKMLEGEGFTVATKEEVRHELEEIVKKQIENIKLAQTDKVYAEHIDKKVDVGTIDDVAFYERLKKAPPVTMSVTIRRNSKGESEEHKRPIIGKGGAPAMNPRTKGPLMENYIKGTINSWPFEISLGADYGTVGQQAVSITVPWPIGEIIANARKTTFLDPRTNYQTTYWPPSLRMEHIAPMENNQFTQQSGFMQGLQNSFMAA